jgi:hypothetical protein
LALNFPKPVRPGPVEGLFFLLSAMARGQEQGQCFDKLSANGMFQVRILHPNPNRSPANSPPDGLGHRQQWTRPFWAMD